MIRCHIVSARKRVRAKKEQQTGLHWRERLRKNRYFFFLPLLAGVAIDSVATTLRTTPSGETVINTPDDARRFGLESLRLAVQKDHGVPLPTNLQDFVKNRNAALQLGKALFWDMQVGSDGVQSCASCHFHAGADNRATNQLNPGLLTVVNTVGDGVQGYFNARTLSDIVFQTQPPNTTLTKEDFPFVKSIQSVVVNPNGTIGPGQNNSNDIASSMGMLFTSFDAIVAGAPMDMGTSIADPVWHVPSATGSSNVRRVEPRNAPSVINAVFNFTNFWDGRANPHFNGQNVFGDQDYTAAIIINDPVSGLAFTTVSIDNASLASQAVAPPTTSSEMSFGNPAAGNFRNLFEIGYKLLHPSVQSGQPIVPLGLQHVHPADSLLGGLSNAPSTGLSISYKQLIESAFAQEYWNSTELLLGPNNIEFNQMEANFGFFFGLAVMLYESTLVSDQAGFDHWMESGEFNKRFNKKALAGLNVFVNEGQCIRCHAGPEFTAASVRNMRNGTHLIRAMAMTQGSALYDNGFYNVAVTPTTDDLARGGKDLFGRPLAFSRQALFDRLGVVKMEFPILGNAFIPAQDEDQAAVVCNDANANQRCDGSESFSLAFQRVAVDGAFKTPGLRNSELTGPYFHNGGVATLRQVVQFYNRGGNFCSFNRRDLHPAIRPLGLTQAQEEQLVAFLLSLTDNRVLRSQAPFDHPELFLPENGLDVSGTRRIEAAGRNGEHEPLRTFLELDPQEPIYTPAETCVSN